ncbi:hypothetical protein D5018_14820 [Parashewanella curva]|uniref:Uncharacterized protein n=1 Tax=Parashewanella curva TaxID=2338552 RepID=A0A3L8PUE4_9GAMM|nr:hypothetical protein [Parashewanella curva]RLV58936.1 hypothetical protein D5018_14820 [Parashewanella curva]
MKTLLLIAALSAPVMADSPVRTFGYWHVLNSGNSKVLTSTSDPVTPRVFAFACLNSAQCTINYLDTPRCAPNATRAATIKAQNDQAVLGFHLSMICDSTGLGWIDSDVTVINHLKWMFTFTPHPYQWFEISFDDDPNSVNHYSLTGGHDAMQFMLGTSSNFNQGQIK